VGDRAVVDLGAEHAGADDERDHRQHGGEAEPDDDGLAPARGRLAERPGRPGEADEDDRQRHQQPDPPAAEQAAQGDAGDGRIHQAPTR
jgi:hypothetical protein